MCAQRIRWGLRFGKPFLGRACDRVFRGGRVGARRLTLFIIHVARGCRCRVLALVRRLLCLCGTLAAASATASAAALGRRAVRVHRLLVRRGLRRFELVRCFGFGFRRMFLRGRRCMRGRRRERGCDPRRFRNGLLCRNLAYRCGLLLRLVFGSNRCCRNRLALVALLRALLLPLLVLLRLRHGLPLWALARVVTVAIAAAIAVAIARTLARVTARGSLRCAF